MEVDEVLDLRGEVCPYTFVKSKLKVETMEPGKTLKIILDHEPATKNVPRSLKGEGHEIISLEKVEEGLWHLYVRVGEV
ncbi:MAG: sulfurtransferase TusA family protein [Candidatus Hydrothermarchaeota archaeon]